MYLYEREKVRTYWNAYFRVSNYERYPRGTDPILPAVLEFREETEEAFLHAVVTDLDPAAPHFKLAPTYTLYLVARYRASTHYRPELTPTERAHRLTVLLARVAAIIHNVIQVCCGNEITKHVAVHCC
jgi:afadin